jgi:hypothetical protein
MIVPVEPKLFTPSWPQKANLSPSATSKTESAADPSARESRLPASIEIDRLVVEAAVPLSSAEIREGFRETWLRHDHTEHLWSPDAFRAGLTIDLPWGVTGRELGRRLAQAILQRAQIH